jgi:hypothetical protein
MERESTATEANTGMTGTLAVLIAVAALLLGVLLAGVIG